MAKVASNCTALCSNFLRNGPGLPKFITRCQSIYPHQKGQSRQCCVQSFALLKHRIRTQNGLDQTRSCMPEGMGHCVSSGTDDEGCRVQTLRADIALHRLTRAMSYRERERERERRGRRPAALHCCPRSVAPGTVIQTMKTDLANARSKSPSGFATE